MIWAFSIRNHISSIQLHGCRCSRMSTSDAAAVCFSIFTYTFTHHRTCCPLMYCNAWPFPWIIHIWCCFTVSFFQPRRKQNIVFFHLIGSIESSFPMLTPSSIVMSTPIRPCRSWCPSSRVEEEVTRPPTAVLLSLLLRILDVFIVPSPSCRSELASSRNSLELLLLCRRCCIICKRCEDVNGFRPLLPPDVPSAREGFHMIFFMAFHRDSPRRRWDWYRGRKYMTLLKNPNCGRKIIVK